jgi:hypothetical protein
VDAFFQRPRADELVDLDIAGLADAEGPVSGLVFHRWIPPAIEMEDMVGSG